MRKSIISTIFIFQTLICSSQINKDEFSFELRYPFPIGNNFLNNKLLDGSCHIGIIDFGIDYNVIKPKNFGFGIIFNTSLLRLPETDITTTVFSPKIKAEYFINKQKFSFVPQIGFGYSRWRFKGPEMDAMDEYGNPIHLNNKLTYNGLSFKGSIKIIIRNSNKLNWYFQLAYEFTRLEKSKYGEIDSNYNRNIQIIYPGLGILYKFKNQ
jgi:hypothetical protein